MSQKHQQMRRSYYIVLGILGYYFLLHIVYAVQYSLRQDTVINYGILISQMTYSLKVQPITIFTQIKYNALFGYMTLFYVGIYSVWVYAKMVDLRKTRKGYEHGSARWASKKDIAGLEDQKDSDNNLIFMQNVKVSMSQNGQKHSRIGARNKNVLVVGGSGSGKTRYFVKPNLMQCHSSFVVTDPKGELLRSCGTMLRQEGYDIKVFNLIQMAHSTNYNPFKYLRDETDMMKLINSLIKNTNNGQKSSDPFWEKAETSLLMAIIAYIFYEGSEDEKHFGMVMTLLGQGSISEEDEDYESPLDMLFKTLSLEKPEHIAIKYYNIFKQAAGKTAKSILVSASVRLALFNIDEVRNLMCTDEINIQELGEKKTALFIIIPDSDDTFNCLVAMLYSQIFDTLYHVADFTYNGRLPIHVRVILDEFANIGVIPNFDKLIATMRSREISATVIIQNMAQLKSMYKESWGSIKGNCDNFLFLGGMETETLEAISKDLGKETIQTTNRSISKGKNGSTSLNHNTLGRSLMTPDELRVMPDQDCLLFIRGMHPIYGKKYDIKTHKRYHMLYEGHNEKMQFDLSSVVTKHLDEKACSKLQGKQDEPSYTRSIMQNIQMTEEMLLDQRVDELLASITEANLTEEDEYIDAVRILTGEEDVV